MRNRARPLGRITPVATSATLGDQGDPAAMLDFARTVFGEEFGADSVVTETRLSLDEWSRGADRTAASGSAAATVAGRPACGERRRRTPGTSRRGTGPDARVLGALYDTDADARAPYIGDDARGAAHLLRHIRWYTHWSLPPSRPLHLGESRRRLLSRSRPPVREGLARMSGSPS